MKGAARECAPVAQDGTAVVAVEHENCSQRKREHKDITVLA